MVQDNRSQQANELELLFVLAVMSDTYRFYQLKNFTISCPGGDRIEETPTLGVRVLRRMQFAKFVS